MSRLEEAKVPLIEDLASAERLKAEQDDHNQSLTERVWIESKKLRRIVGPAIFSRLASYSMLVITQAFAGPLAILSLLQFLLQIMSWSILTSASW